MELLSDRSGLSGTGLGLWCSGSGQRPPGTAQLRARLAGADFCYDPDRDVGTVRASVSGLGLSTSNSTGRLFLGVIAEGAVTVDGVQRVLEGRRDAAEATHFLSRAGLGVSVETETDGIAVRAGTGYTLHAAARTRWSSSRQDIEVQRLPQEGFLGTLEVAQLDCRGRDEWALGVHLRQLEPQSQHILHLMGWWTPQTIQTELYLRARLDAAEVRVGYDTGAETWNAIIGFSF